MIKTGGRSVRGPGGGICRRREPQECSQIGVSFYFEEGYAEFWTIFCYRKVPPKNFGQLSAIEKSPKIILETILRPEIVQIEFLRLFCRRKSSIKNFGHFSGIGKSPKRIFWAFLPQKIAPEEFLGPFWHKKVPKNIFRDRPAIGNRPIKIFGDHSGTGKRPKIIFPDFR